MDKINPNHYKQGKIECIDAIESATIRKKGLEAVCVANVIKYLWRYEEKNGAEDIKKAQWYLGKLLSIVEVREDEENVLGYIPRKVKSYEPTIKSED